MAARASWAREALSVVVLCATGLLGVQAALLAGPACADDKAPAGPSYRVVDPSLVYLGNPRLFKKPLSVAADRVYRAIPEYLEILAKNLTDKDVRYHFLMKKASDKFVRAIRDVSRDLACDLVAGSGAVLPETADTPAVPDGTDAAIARLPSSP